MDLADYYRSGTGRDYIRNTIKQRSDMRFEIRRSTDNQFYYVLIASNGKILITSETMTKKQSCEQSIHVIWDYMYKNPLVKIVDTTIDG